VFILLALLVLTTQVHGRRESVLYEDLRDIVLVGYSYGGAVVAAALDHVADRVRELAFVDAFVPGDGESVSALSGRSVLGHQSRRRVARSGTGP
jgi:pimeloyl-ACP methyl ester carboxylesterase